MQAKRWAPYHGGGENDYTVLFALLKATYQNKEWQIYGYAKEKNFIYDLDKICDEFKQFKFINSSELKTLSKTMIFDAVYSSNIAAFPWIKQYRLQFKRGIIVIHGIRRYEIAVRFFDLFLPNRLRDKIFIIKSLFIAKQMRNKIAKAHEAILANLAPEINLIATSNDTRNKLLAFCPSLPPERIQTIYTSPKIKTKTKREHEDDLLKRYRLKSKKFFLLISLSRIEKNIYFALKNLAHLCQEHALPFKIFACGEVKPNFFINRLKCLPFIEIQGYIPPGDLDILYKHAFLFVYPTLSEGFGMPLLEAMEHGTPVCCSALSPLIEVGGDAPEYFSLHNHLEFQSKILKLHYDKSFYEQKSKLSKSRFEQISAIQKVDLQHKKSLILGDVSLDVAL